MAVGSMGVSMGMACAGAVGVGTARAGGLGLGAGAFWMVGSPTSMAEDSSAESPMTIALSSPVPGAGLGIATGGVLGSWAH